MPEVKQVNLKVDPKLWQQAKIQAIALGMDLKDYVAAAIREKLKQKGVE